MLADLAGRVAARLTDWAQWSPRRLAPSQFRRRFVRPNAEVLEPREMLAGDALPDFQLRDVNTTSNRFNEFVSPRDYEGEISVWYFGHST